MAELQGPDNSRAERLNQMMLTWERDLTRVCCLYLRDAALAQDAVQETFLKAYRHMDAFQGRSSEKTWLLRIAINTCKDMRRGSWFRFVDRAVTPDTLPIPVSPPQRRASRADHGHHEPAP